MMLLCSLVRGMSQPLSRATASVGEAHVEKKKAHVWVAYEIAP
jgi:hypothetical protein